MDGRGGCCIARHMAGGGAYDRSKVDRIMLRFRPIAPKPVAAGSVSGPSTVPENKESRAKAAARRKRTYVRDGECNGGRSSGRRCSKKRKVAPASEEENESNGKTESGGSSISSVEREKEAVVTLPLLPVKPVRKESQAMESTHSAVKKDPAIWLCFGNQLPQQPHGVMSDSHVTGHVRCGRPLPTRAVVGSWVRVECVTGTWVNGYSLGRTDHEKAMNLDRDTCPGFISDGLNRVRWANRAYRDLVGHTGESEVVVWVVMGDGVTLPASAAAFTCRVRVVTCGKEKTLTILLCDVWRMDTGGFAWRLDTEAALSLGMNSH